MMLLKIQFILVDLGGSLKQLTSNNIKNEKSLAFSFLYFGSSYISK